jgi:anti-anti-sigma factor
MVLTMSPSLGEAIRQGPVPRVSPEGDRTVVWLSGECDSATLTVLAKRFATAIAVDDADLVDDLAEVQFIDAATIGLFIRARNFLRRRSRQLTLRNPPRCAQRVLDVCGLAGLIDSAPPDSGQAMSSSAPALSSWVPVPPTDRADPGSRRSAALNRDAVDSDPDERLRSRQPPSRWPLKFRQSERDTSSTCRGALRQLRRGEHRS